MKKIFIFGFIISLFTASSNLLLTLDLLLIKSLIVENYVKLYTGYYTAVQTIARIPFFLMVPINLVLFPIISRSTFSQNNEETRYYINNGLRYNLAIMTLIVVLISSSSKEIILIIYSKEYLPAWSSLTVLSVGMLFYSLLITSSTIISSSGKPKISLIILVIVLISDLILNYVLIPKYELIGAAISTSLASLLGLFIAAGYVLSKFKAFMTFKSITRITISGILIYFLANKIHASGFMLLVEMMCMGVLYFLSLLVSREISKQDIASLKGVFRIRNV
jgi:O-antigen/teichoic acid export membrane protein